MNNLKVTRRLAIFVLILMIPSVFALCENNQIDINSASLEELDKLYGIGPAKAQAIINTRPFNSVDDLIKVYGIGEVTLQNIKNQGLACVEDEKESKTDETEEDKNETENKEIINNTEEIKKEYKVTDLNDYSNKETITSNVVEEETIFLSPKDIKTNDNSSNQGKKAIYGFIICILIIFFLLIKRKRKDGIE